MFEPLTPDEALRLMSKLSTGYCTSVKLCNFTLKHGGYDTAAYRVAADTADEIGELFTEVYHSSSWAT